ncbi:hypothetical protein EVA_18093 [gut metagenome]|uniref:Uncharacterized protein n=1 Tax=gut metagenome TaxID=749906 RepID=J9FH83_9ZZZZ
MVNVEPLSFNSNIDILSGNNVQTFNRESQEYEPDRTLVPLVLMPTVITQDPHGIQNGRQEIASVEWYEGVPAKDGSNRISAGTDYEIGDGAVANFPKNALKCKKNISPDAPIEIFVIAVFVDKRKNTEVRVKNSISVYTSYYDIQNLSVKVNQPKVIVVNPLTVKPDAEGYWKHTIGAQLYSGTAEVPDKNAAYWWEIGNNGNWRAVNNDDTATWIDCKDKAGNFTKTLTFDARMIQAGTAFRVRAAYYENERPASPKSEELMKDVTVVMKMPESLSVETIQTKGARQNISMSEPVAYEAVISYNKNLIPAEKYNLFDIEWYGRSTKPGSKDVLIGKGKTIEFVPKDKGFNDAKYPVIITASVKMYNGHHFVSVTRQGETEPTIVTMGGVPVIVPTYV